MPEFQISRRSLLFLSEELPGIGGVLKTELEDFQVDEIPAYPPSGEGEHLFVQIEKRDVSSELLQAHLAKSLGIHRGDIGVAGMKDRRAVTRQFISVPANCIDRLAEVETDAIHVLDSCRHTNKLKTGHLRGNRFSILVRDVSDDALDRASAIAKPIEQLGFPNYFGDQRFGHEGKTLELGFDLLTGRKKPRDLSASRRRFLLRLSISAVQSGLFNDVLAERIEDGLLQDVLQGDVMQVVQSGGKFVVEDIESEQARFESGEIVTTGPMFGPKMHKPEGVAGEREQRVLDRWNVSIDQFERYSKVASGTRRPLIVSVEDLSIEQKPDGLRFQFTLPKGTYATMLLREFMRNEDE